jgi:hypothetical protein
MEKEIDVNEVLKYMRETIGLQAQEIALLKAKLEQYTDNS